MMSRIPFGAVNGSFLGAFFSLSFIPLESLQQTFYD